MKFVRPILTVLFLVAFAVPAHAARIQEITTRSGITAWLVEDHKLPLVAMRFAFRGGAEQDPVDKQGLANLSLELLDEGAGPYDVVAFQKKLSDRSITMGFSAGRDALFGSLKCLSADRQEAFDLLTLALTKPRIDAKDFERAKGQQLTGIRAQFGSPEWQARYALFQKVFANHPYGERRLGSINSLASLTRDDVRGFLGAHFARDNLVIAVAGDITPAELKRILTQSFGKLPAHAHLAPISDAEFPADPTTILVPRDGTQTELLFAMPGPKAGDPDYHATEIANYILGGGGFSSRLMQDVRDKKGLTYGISTGLSAAEHSGLVVGQAATDNPKTKEAWDIVQATMRHFYDDGVTEKEINGAKDYLTGSLPLALTSTDRIADILVNMQINHWPSTYLDDRKNLIRNVSAADVQAAIRRWFNPDRLMLAMVGNPQGMTATETRALVRE